MNEPGCKAKRLPCRSFLTVLNSRCRSRAPTFVSAGHFGIAFPATVQLLARCLKIAQPEVLTAKGLESK
jgi:hypothetical protein